MDNYSRIFLSLLICISTATAATKYLAIPIDGIDVIEVNPATRVPRQTEAYVPVFVPREPAEPESQLARIERSSPIIDYVDFGAQTGANGAFSWYADYPAHH